MEDSVREVVDKATRSNKEQSSEDEEEEEFHDTEEADSNNDLTRPSDWTPGNTSTSGQQPDGDGSSSSKADPAGHLPGSPDYVDEAALEQLETLSQEEKEQKRLLANQYKLEGNALYKEGKTQEAIEKYTAGLRVCPLSYAADRAVLHANRGQMKRVLGLQDHAIQDCSRAVQLSPEYLKALLRRAEIYEETDKLDEALADYQKVLQVDPQHLEANRAVRRLPAKIEERNEKLKAEMMDSLKKLGNMVLKPFGLSTDNFKMEQDPNTGGYNIKFDQGK